MPAGLLDDAAELHRPPAPIGVLDLLPGSLPDAWQGQTATAASIAEAISAKEGKILPWSVVRTAITGAMQAGLLERTGDSGAWPCDAADARFIKLEVPTATPPPPAGSFQASATVASHEIQNVADSIDDLLQASVGYRLTFTLSIELARDGTIPEELVARLNELLEEVAPNLKPAPKH